jgi:hypothetical protein
MAKKGQVKKNSLESDFGAKFYEAGISYTGRMGQIAKRVNYKLQGISWEIRRDTINEATKDYIEAERRGTFRAKYGQRSKTDFINTIVDRRCADAITWIQRERDQRRWGRRAPDRDAGKQSGLGREVRWGTAFRQIFIDEQDNLDRFLSAGDKQQSHYRRSHEPGPDEICEELDLNRKAFWYPTLFPEMARQFKGLRYLGKLPSKEDERPGHVHTGYMYLHFVCDPSYPFGQYSNYPKLLFNAS